MNARIISDAITGTTLRIVVMVEGIRDGDRLQELVDAIEQTIQRFENDRQAR